MLNTWRIPGTLTGLGRTLTERLFFPALLGRQKNVAFSVDGQHTATKNLNSTPDSFTFGRTDERDLSADDLSLSERVRGGL
jgi:hypothetical protein